MEYRKASRKDIPALVENRVEFVSSIRNLPDTEAFQDSTRHYLEEHIDQEDLVVFLALQEGEIISSCMVCLFQTIPLPSCLSGKCGELLNVYTKKEYRRQGHAEKIIRMLMEQVKASGAEKLLLHYTEQGLPLYQKLGFTRLENQMQVFL